MGFKLLWDPGRLSQKSDWPDLIRSLGRQEKQAKVLTAILSFLKEKGTPIDFYPLTRHGSSSRFWQNRFVSTYALREFFEKLNRERTCSYRYAWVALRCLVISGLVEANVVAPIRGRKIRGYCFSDRAFRYLNNAVHVIPKLWKS